MADMSSLDELLSSSLKSVAEPANSAGVADAIRSRVASGDAGTSVAGSTAPGWTAGGGSAFGILPWLGLIVVGGIVGAVLGVTGVFGAPAGPVDDAVPAYVLVPDTAVAYVCPGGPEAGALPAGTRVFAIQRSEDSGYLGVRNPNDLRQTLWFEARDVVVDQDAAEIEALPVGACPEVTVIVVTPTPTPEPTQDPEPEPSNNPQPPPPAPSDTTPPSIKVGNWNPGSLVGIEFGYCSNTAQITVNASDNVGIANVTGVSNRPGSPVSLVSSGGGAWVFKITGGSYTSPTPTNITVTFTATDTSGRTASGSRTIPIYNSCLI